MTRTHRVAPRLGLAVALLLATSGCGNGETAVVGVGNGGNTFYQEGLADELAEALAEYQGTTEVTDEILGEIFGSILDRARAGDTEAALIVLRVAEEQREAEQD